ncbi:MAG: family 43 glycosylhydrolase [Opitutaceae bacterium]|nr:family 43 glycosylhydrolase [Opitutaceae bacterium]
MPSNIEYKRLAKNQSLCFREVYSPTGRYVNDHCIIQGKDHLFHLFHIVGPTGKGCYDDGSEITFGHATSEDLLLWTTQPDTLSIDPLSSHEPHHLFAPYIFEKENKYYLFYSGINTLSQAEYMCLATSDDLTHWIKHTENPVFQPSPTWAEYTPSSGIWSCCRDAHIFFHPKHNYILYYVTWIKGTKGKTVALGAASSDDLITWKDRGPVMVRPYAPNQSTVSMESPCVIERNGKFYLFYKHQDETRLVISEDPFNFTDQTDHWFSITHASEFFESAGQWYISSCSRALLDLDHSQTDRTKGLYLARLNWENEIPQIIPFEAAK